MLYILPMYQFYAHNRASSLTRYLVDNDVHVNVTWKSCIYIVYPQYLNLIYLLLSYICYPYIY